MRVQITNIPYKRRRIPEYHFNLQKVEFASCLQNL